MTGHTSFKHCTAQETAFSDYGEPVQLNHVNAFNGAYRISVSLAWRITV